jgi:hypothetical protein
MHRMSLECYHLYYCRSINDPREQWVQLSTFTADQSSVVAAGTADPYDLRGIVDGHFVLEDSKGVERQALSTFTALPPYGACATLLSERGRWDRMASGCELEGIPGVGPATAKRLREAQLTTLESVAVATAHELSQAGIEYDVAEKITQRARGKRNCS